jgi:hypothetical protein
MSIDAVSLSHSAQLEALKEENQITALLTYRGSRISFSSFSASRLRPQQSPA